MPAKSKLEQFGLLEEAKQLRKMDYSYEKIASILKKNHPGIPELAKLSAMSVMRALNGSIEREYEESLKEGKDPLLDFQNEYKTFMKDIQKKTLDLYNRAMRLLEKAEQKNDDILTMKAIREARETIKQLRDNAIAVQQFGEKRTTSIYNINLKKEVYIKNILLSFVQELSNLCPECRKKTLPALIKKLEDLEEP